MALFDEYVQFSRRKVSNAAYTKREFSVSEFIPYQYHLDRETIITKNKEVLQVIKVEGFSFETADDEDVDMKKMVRNSLFKSLADGTFAVWFHTVRRRKSAYPAGNMPKGFASALNDAWRKKHDDHESFVNELYITVVRKANTVGIGKIKHYFTKLTDTLDERQKVEAFQEGHKELKEAVYRILATLRDYNPRLLSSFESEHGLLSEPLEFLGMLINGGVSQRMHVPNMDLSHYLPMQRHYFGTRAVEMRGTTQTRFGAIISIREYAPFTSASIMDAYLQLPFEYIISQSFVFTGRQTAISQMQTQQRRMMSAEDVAVSQVAEISDALDLAMSGHVAFGKHHLSILVLEDNLVALEDAVSQAIAEMVNIGMNPVREKLVMEQTFWSQLPGNFDMIGRASTINTQNLAGFASLHNYPTGNIRGNHWGNAVTVFDTTSGTPYFFSFHHRDVGHTTVIGPTGSGKTVLMNFLCAQAQKFNCRLFFFDKDRGAEIFIRAVGGNYSIIEPSERCGFNPLHLPDTNENRNFIAEWLRTLVTINDEKLTPEELGMIQDAVIGNFKLAKKDRMLRNIAPFFGIDKPGSTSSRLRQWHSDGRYARIFDNPYDNLDFSTHRTFGFEMGEVLADKTTLGPVLLYLFHKVNLSLDGTPTMIVLDEAWALVDNKLFASKIKDWLKTLRKLNAFVVFATQSVEDATNSDISDTLIQQTATQIFLPNPKATEQYRKAFMLSEREFNLLKTTDPASRFFLCKQGKDVVVARIDLAGMGDVISVLSGRAETVRVMDDLRKNVSEDPEIWLPQFYKRVRELRP